MKTLVFDLDNTLLWHTKEQIEKKMWLTHPTILYSRLPNFPSLPKGSIILSSINSKEEAKAKRKWARDFFPNNRLILTRRPKYEVLNPKTHILIDDYKKNIEEWMNHGGEAYKFINHINSYPTTPMKYCHIVSCSPFVLKANNGDILYSDYEYKLAERRA